MNKSSDTKEVNESDINDHEKSINGEVEDETTFNLLYQRLKDKNIDFKLLVV